jgi:hypothetical protein
MRILNVFDFLASPVLRVFLDPILDISPVLALFLKRVTFLPFFSTQLSAIFLDTSTPGWVKDYLEQFVFFGVTHFLRSLWERVSLSVLPSAVAWTRFMSGMHVTAVVVNISLAFGATHVMGRDSCTWGRSRHYTWLVIAPAALDATSKPSLRAAREQ